MIWALGDCESSDFNAAPILTYQINVHKKHTIIKRLVNECTGLRSSFSEDIKELFKDIRAWTEFRNLKVHAEWFMDLTCSPIQPSVLMRIMGSGERKFETAPVSTQELEDKIMDAVSLVIRSESLISEARQYHEDRRSAASHTNP